MGAASFLPCLHAANDESNKPASDMVKVFPASADNMQS
jgi:hypothetical protein